MPKPADEAKAVETVTADELARQELEQARGELLEAARDFRAFALRVAETSDERTLDERMAAVQLELENVPRRGHADVETRSGAKYSYDYITEADLMAGVRPLLARHGIATYYSDRLIRWSEGTAEVEVTITFAAAGEERTLTATGTGSDFGDKAANKAKTSAVRYLLWKTFLQPSDEDPEQDNVETDAAAAAAQGRAEQADRKAASPPRRPPAETRPRLIQRINTLAVELDEVQGRAAGATLGELPEKARQAIGYEGDWPNAVSEPELVTIGTALANHLAEERAAKERDKTDYTPTDFEIPVAS